MLKVMTSTCLRDRDLFTRLHRQLKRFDVDHYAFVEASEVESFRALDIAPDHVLVKPDGGDNGLGRGGSMVRWHCHQQLMDKVGENDTFVNIDSDVIFQSDDLVRDLECFPGEIRAFLSDGPTLTCRGATFYHCSGMAFAAHGSVFLRAMSIPRDDLFAACGDMAAAGITPSEDVAASWLYQTRGGATTVTNLSTKYRRGGPECALWHAPLGTPGAPVG